MHHHLLWKAALFWTGCLVVPVALALPPQTSTVPSSPKAAASAAKNHEGAGCNGMYYRYLPGMVNYCLGLRDWRSGGYRSGLGMLKRAAGWGSKGAQYSLGMIYYNGRHVRRDRALGIAWLMLANERHNDARIDRVLRSAITWATPEQRQRSKQLFDQMRKRYGDKVAAARAWRQLEHWKRYVASGSMSMNATLCMVPNGAGGPAQRRVSNIGAQLEGTIMEEHATKTTVGVSASGVYTGPCITAEDMDKALSQLASVYFHGWQGVVTVEPLQPVPASSSGY